MDYKKNLTMSPWRLLILFRIDDSLDPLLLYSMFFMLESGSCYWQVEMEHMDMQKWHLSNEVGLRVLNNDVGHFRASLLYEKFMKLCLQICNGKAVSYI